MALAAIVGTGGAETINFADLSLASNSYWNGSDGSGGFSSGGAFFNNSYDSDYGSWSGWSYSNVNYSNTSFEPDPIGNPWYQFAAVTGTGVGGNAIYAVGYGNSGMLSDGVLPTIAIPNGMQVQSAMFTNTTYAAASMLNGDQFAKQFGPSDWFLLTISGLNSSGSSVGSVNYYLASSGTITTKWQTVNLSSLSLATSLEFDLHSSDTGLYGMNTPAYFAMDDLVLSPASSATGGSWINPQGGTWGSGPNWSGGSLPSGGALVFAGSTSGTAVVTLDGNQAASALQFGDSSAISSYLITAGSGGALTLGTSAGASITVVSGTHTISAPITLAGSVAITPAANTQLTISGNIDESPINSDYSLNLSGPGTLILSGSNSYTNGTTVNGGTLYVTDTNAISEETSLTVAAGGVFIFDPSAADAQSLSVSQDSPAAVPEPEKLALLAAGGLCFIARRFLRRRRVELTIWTAGACHHFSIRPFRNQHILRAL